MSQTDPRVGEGLVRIYMNVLLNFIPRSNVGKRYMRIEWILPHVAAKLH